MNGTAEGDGLGEDGIAMSGDGKRMVIGAIHEAGYFGHPMKGYVQVWERSGGENHTWTQVPKCGMIRGDQLFSQFGKTVAISHDGTTIAVAAPMFRVGNCFGLAADCFGRGKVSIFTCPKA